jgi:hypothetical protein
MELNNKDKQFVREYLRPKYPGFSYSELLNLYKDNYELVNYEFQNQKLLKQKQEVEILERKQEIVNKRKNTIYNKRLDKKEKVINKHLTQSRMDELEDHSYDYLDYNIVPFIDKKHISSSDGFKLINHFRKHSKMVDELNELKIAHHDLIKKHEDINQKYEELLLKRPDANKVNRMSHAISDSKLKHQEKRKNLVDSLTKELYGFKIKIDKSIYDFIKKLFSIILNG